MDSMYKLREMKEIDMLCVAHSTTLEPNSIMINASQKINQMIETREKKDEKMLDQFRLHNRLTIDELYEVLYNGNYDNDKSSQYYKNFLKVQLERFL
mmetsp:Transcript_23788/g.23485  ORF Transcript_23788/g.23485 Transcript_23788/m.23485 type:complete len:97 (-) Transcript_23788:80-370(-)